MVGVVDAMYLYFYLYLYLYEMLQAGLVVVYVDVCEFVVTSGMRYLIWYRNDRVLSCGVFEV